MEKAKDPSIFCAGFVVTEIGGEYYSYCVRKTDQNNLKAAGGMNDPGEDLSKPEKVLERELIEELSIRVEESVLVHQEDYPDSNHKRYFFLVIKSSNLPNLNVKKVFQVTEGGKITEELEAGFYRLREFAERLYVGQHKAFAKVLATLAINREFFRKYVGLFQKFPLP